MARYDKYDGVSGGFRGTAAEAADPADFGKILGASTDVDGHTLLGDPGNTGFTGVCIVDRTKRKAGDRLDIMTNGEIVLDSDEPGGLLTPGTTYYLNAATGVLQTAESRYHVGHTEEAFRLVVRFSDQGAA
jgi:hypothetical protein